MYFCFCNSLQLSLFFSLSLFQVYFHINNFFFLMFISTIPLIPTIFFLASSLLSFFSKRYVSYTRSKDEIVRIWCTFGQVVIFLFFFIIIIITIIIFRFVSSFNWKCTFLFYTDNFKVKCWRGIITTNVIVFIFIHLYIVWWNLCEKNVMGDTCKLKKKIKITIQ